MDGLMSGFLKSLCAAQKKRINCTWVETYCGLSRSNAIRAHFHLPPPPVSVAVHINHCRSFANSQPKPAFHLTEATAEEKCRRAPCESDLSLKDSVIVCLGPQARVAVPDLRGGWLLSLSSQKRNGGSPHESKQTPEKTLSF